MDQHQTSRVQLALKARGGHRASESVEFDCSAQPTWAGRTYAVGSAHRHGSTGSLHREVGGAIRSTQLLERSLTGIRPPGKRASVKVCWAERCRCVVTVEQPNNRESGVGFCEQKHGEV